MENLRETEKKIYGIRQSLYKVMDNKGNLLDKEVIDASRKLNFMLNEYNELLKKKIR